MTSSLRITARIGGPAALPHGPIALDGLLMWALATRDGLPPALTAQECRPLPIPIAKSSCGRVYLCSVSLYEAECHEQRWTNRRFPLPEAQAMAGPKLKRILIAGGPCKSYRLPLEATHVKDDMLTWYADGDAEGVSELLSLVGYLGKRRSVGYGRVLSWHVETCERWPGFPVVREGKPLRVLPVDWPGLGEPERGYRVLSPPYWDRTREELCAVP